MNRLRETTAALLIALFMISTFAVIYEAKSSLIPIQANSGTEVGGIIFEDIIWSDKNYIAKAHILVPEEVTLTIDPGVEISLEDHFIQVDGTLRAIGTENERIIFTGSGTSYDSRDGRIVFTETSLKWNEDNKTGSILEYCELSSIDGVIVRINSGAFPKISNCILKGTTDAIWAYEGLIVNNTISNNGRGIMTFSSHHLRETSIFPKIFIIDNIISNNALGIYVCDGYYSPIIVNNIISDNRGGMYHGGGIRIDGSKPEIKNNTIYNNSPHGIIFITYLRTNLSINYNNIYSNSDYGFYLYDTEFDINCSYNWWGTTNKTEIEDNIYDFNEDFRLGNIIYKPILQNPITNFEIEPEIPPKPAEFFVSDLSITPEEVEPGGEVTISVLVTNIGEETGDYTITLDLPAGPYLREKTVSLKGGESERVEFEVLPDLEGTYDVTVDGLTGSFTVKAPLKPAEFEFSNLNQFISIEEDMDITFFVDVSNVGDIEGTYQVVLILTGGDILFRAEYITDVTLPGGASEEVPLWIHDGLKAGAYQVEVEGLTGSFTVVKPDSSFWDKIPGFPYESIIIGLIAVIIIIWCAQPWRRGLPGPCGDAKCLQQEKEMDEWLIRRPRR